tara:strand:- start:2854 stop:4233 length:1380 start_codon:yes stop_codon:yes gene_type:complete
MARNFFRQINPICESNKTPLDIVQQLVSEATMSIAQLKKRDNLNVLKDLIDNKKPIDTTIGSRIMSWINPQNKVAYDNLTPKSSDKDFQRVFPRGAEVFVTDKNEKLKLSGIEKTDIFGGGKGSGGGSSGTKDAESGQCVYLQVIWDNPKTEFTPEEISSAYDKVYVDATKDGVLKLSDDWVTSSITSAKLLYRVLGKRKYSFHRGSAWVSKLGEYFKDSGQDYFTDINKWTPADIWLIDDSQLGKYDFGGGVGLPYLNNILLQAYAARDIIGVSLKKTTKAKLSQMNYRKPFKEPNFTRVNFGKRDYFKSKDGYIQFKEGEIQFRTFPAFQGEIIGKTAKHGKISGDSGPLGPIGKVMRSIGAQPIPARKDITAMIKQQEDEFFQKFHNEYSQAVQKPLSLKDFRTNLSRKDSGWLESKYLVTFMFNRIRGKEQLFLSKAFRYAKSQSKESAVHLKVY